MSESCSEGCAVGCKHCWPYIQHVRGCGGVCSVALCLTGQCSILLYAGHAVLLSLGVGEACRWQDHLLRAAAGVFPLPRTREMTSCIWASACASCTGRGCFFSFFCIVCSALRQRCWKFMCMRFWNAAVVLGLAAIQVCADACFWSCVVAGVWVKFPGPNYGAAGRVWFNLVVRVFLL
ncbi:hypothetical protein TraAM80_01141 [Trypanosoma rangeli]|uniref:Uncharacterized protein n=1 Tax=Trypanosoma rangeli TaxID=5698 RepID=A0A3R7N0W8_TRYRA|nr:uncharacterized protein TraAM80_01141 [Trypanosoma rangeli]RNF11014.1 hypothetical protein TraAM80_01141 [Trypanosoma rangeli]|eukprot:RNF11014.1 hypothetical protein TraAM80_01141 [Trypanosoma rangeli]